MKADDYKQVFADLEEYNSFPAGRPRPHSLCMKRKAAGQKIVADLKAQFAADMEGAEPAQIAYQLIMGEVQTVRWETQHPRDQKNWRDAFNAALAAHDSKVKEAEAATALEGAIWSMVICGIVGYALGTILWLLIFILTK